MADLVLAVDLGTSGAKVAVVSADGDVVAHGFEPTSLILTDDGGVEQDPEQWWRAISAATRRMLAESDVDPTRIVAACMSAQWGGTVAVGRDGRHLHNALIWMDGRGEPHAKRLLGGGVEVPGTGYNARKLAHWVRTAGGPPSLSGKDPVGQVQWFKHNRPDVYRATAYFLDVPEYLTMRMTGRAVATYDSIAIRWCTDNRDARRVRYDPRLLRQGDLDRARLPELVPPATVVGRVLPEVAWELGIPDTVQIVGGVGDTVATAVGAGAVRDYEPHLYVGTSAWLSCHTPVKRTDARHAIASLPSVVPGRYWIANVQETAGKALSWMADNVVWAADGLIDQPMPDDRMERLNALAEKAAPGSDGVLFLPWLNGERTPAEDDNLRGAWFNLSLHTERADLARSVFEGVALNTRWMLDAVERFVGRELPSGLDDIRFVGGGARSTLLCQTMADVLDRRVHQMADPVQANARGAGFIALAALGRLRWQDVPDLVSVGTTYTPTAAHRPLFDRMYATFRGFHKATKSVYAQHNQNPREAA